MNMQKNGINLLLVAEAALLIAVLVIGLLGGAAGVIKDNNIDNPVAGGTQNSGSNRPSQGKPDGTEAGDDSEEPAKWYVPEEYTETRVNFSESVEAKLASMTLEQKVAQLFVITPEALTGYNAVTVFGNASKEAFNKYPVGGLVYTTKNFQNAAQVSLLLKGARDYGQQQFGIPLFTSIEEEGGAKYSPLATALGLSVTASASELASQGLSAVEQAAKLRGEYIAQYGFNLSLSTIADVSASADTPYAQRTYGTDASLVAGMVAAEVAASKNAGLVTTLKCFPGKANMQDEWMSTETFEELCSGSLISYQAGIDAGADVVMIGNVIIESITDDMNVPCSLSGRTVGLLRESMGFQGIIMTDDFSSEVFAAAYDTESACVEAIKAGVDMIYMPADFAKAYDAVLAAVNNGNISADRLNNAVGRILTVKGV